VLFIPSGCLKVSFFKKLIAIGCNLFENFLMFGLQLCLPVAFAGFNAWFLLIADSSFC
jgi:hypothetical protein